MRFWLELTACFALNPGTLITGIDLCSPVPDTQGPVSAESLHPFTSKQKQTLYRRLLFSLKDESDLCTPILLPGRRNRKERILSLRKR